MTDLLAYIPMPSTALGVAVGGIGGYLLGRWDEHRHHRKGMR